MEASLMSVGPAPLSPTRPGLTATSINRRWQARPRLALRVGAGGASPIVPRRLHLRGVRRQEHLAAAIADRSIPEGR
jgi:hypothetical protein